jgi:heptosyltransferase II
MELDPKNIIVRMPNWIGDLVMATPVLSDLRKAFPKARITAMCRSPTAELLSEDPEIDELFCFSKASVFGRHDEKRNIIEKLRQGKYDVGILLTHSFSSAWWFWQGKVAMRLGYDCNGRKLLLTHSIPLDGKIREQHLVTTYKQLLLPLDIPISTTAPRLYIQEKEVQAARELLKKHGVLDDQLIVGINPGATYGSAKCWLPERFREVTQHLLVHKKIAVVYFGDQATESLVKEICQGLSPQVVNLAGVTSLRELSALISLCDVLLTNDSGPMHIADAVGTAIVALFGSTNEQVTAPFNKSIVIHKHVECSPCYQRKCPIDFRCMKRIGSDEVYQKIMSLLNI